MSVSIKDNDGNIVKVSGSNADVNVVDTLSSDSIVDALSAKQGKVLNKRIKENKEILEEHLENTDIHVTTEDKEYWNNKQDALVFDDAPTADSPNVLSSGAMYNTLNTVVTKTDMKEVNKKIDGIQLTVDNINSAYAYPNYILNSNFTKPINQRGVTVDTWTSGYGLDMWWKSSYLNIKSMSDNGLEIVKNNDDNDGFLQQLFSSRTIVSGATYYVSACINNQIYKSDGFIFPKSNGTGGIYVITTDTFKIFVNTNNSYQFINIISTSTTETITIKWIKLEENNKVTPYVAPLYADELAKCQQNFFIYSIPQSLYYTFGDDASLTSGTGAGFTITIPMSGMDTYRPTCYHMNKLYAHNIETEENYEIMPLAYSTSASFVPVPTAIGVYVNRIIPKGYYTINASQDKVIGDYGILYVANVYGGGKSL